MSNGDESPAFHATGPFDDDGRLAVSICCTCGYDLRGVMPSENCPECGRPLRDSLMLLRETDGQAVLWQSRAQADLSGLFLVGILMLIWPVGMIVMCVDAFRLTRRGIDSATERSFDRHMRWLARGGAVVACSAGIAIGAIEVCRLVDIGVPVWSGTIAWAVWQASMGIQVAAVLHVLSRWSRRLFSASLARRFALAGNLLGLACVLLAFRTIALALSGSDPHEDVADAMMWTIILSTLAGMWLIRKFHTGMHAARVDAWP